MTTEWKYGRAIPERLLTLEEPGKPLLFDADRGLTEEVSTRCNLRALVQSLKGKDEKEVQDILSNFGKELMRLTIELADGKYLDRAGEMIERVAKQTGISFPHSIERYVELSLLASRPLDRWNIAKATTKELVLQVSSCRVQKLLQEAGYGGLPCQAMCLVSFKTAAEKTGVDLKIEVTKTLPRDKLCEFVFAL